MIRILKNRVFTFPNRGSRVWAVILVLAMVIIAPEWTTRVSWARSLTPLNLINPNGGVADTQFYPDETLGMDEHLSSCWNDKRTANLHEKILERRANYEEYFQDKRLWLTTNSPMPSLFTLTGERIGLRMFDKKSSDSTIGMNLWNETFAYTKSSVPFCVICEEPPKVDHPTKKRLKGNFVAFTSRMWGHYGHSTHDVLPWFAYLKELTAHDPAIKYILLHYRRAKEILSVLDPDFVSHRVTWVKLGQRLEINGTVTTIGNTYIRDNNLRFMDFLRHWASKGRKDRQYARNKIIYYDRRNPVGTTMKRFIRPDIENEIISRITDAMQRQGRKEDLIIFNGFYPGGQRMTSYEQFLLFKDATTIIGPHGSGISGNLLWTNPKPRDCDDRVKVLEFIGGSDTASPDDVNATVHSHWLWMRGWPLDYHHIMYEQNSTKDELFLDLDTVTEALDSMWGHSA